MEKLLKEQYGLQVERLDRIQVGVGGDTFLVDAREGKYVCKVVEAGGINHPELESVACERLHQVGVPVPVYLSTKSGDKMVSLENEKVLHVQTYIEGNHYAPHCGEAWLMEQSAAMLGKIHRGLDSLEDFPIGIGEDFFRYMTPENAAKSYEKSIQSAINSGREDLLEDLHFRLQLVRRMKPLKVDLSRLTRCNTHGDYTINQLIAKDQKLVGIVDWTSVCVHPVCWEIMRSFMYGAPSAKEGMVDEKQLKSYVDAYELEHPLSEYDHEMLKSVYYYQLAVCDYYGQYLESSHENQEDFLWQAQFATKVLSLEA